MVDLIPFSTADLFIAKKGCCTVALYLYSPSMQFRPVGLDLISSSIGHSLRACCRRQFAFALIHFWQALLKVNPQNIGSIFCLTLVRNLGPGCSRGPISGIRLCGGSASGSRSGEQRKPFFVYKNLGLVLIFWWPLRPLIPLKGLHLVRNQYCSCIVLFDMNCATSDIEAAFSVSFLFNTKHYTFCLAFPGINPNFFTDKPVTYIRESFIEFLLDFLDIQ